MHCMVRMHLTIKWSSELVYAMNLQRVKAQIHEMRSRPGLKVERAVASFLGGGGQAAECLSSPSLGSPE